MQLVDTHCHIQSAGLEKGERITRELWSKAPDLTSGQMIADAKAAEVTRLVCVGCDLEDSQLAVEFVEEQENCWASVGIHPHEAKQHANQEVLLKEFSGLIGRPKVIAVGETGLDYFYEHSPRETQIELLKFQIELALKHDLPLIFHVREAFEDFWPIFESYQSSGQLIRGVLHSFTDSMENMRRAIGQGLYIGVNGIATFTKNPAQLEVYKAIPPKSLLLETDAPFLTPTPYRGTINQPKQVRVVAEFLSDLKGQSLEQLAEVTTGNALQLFGLK